MVETLKGKQQYSQNCPNMKAQTGYMLDRLKILIAIHPRFNPSIESLTQNIRKQGDFQELPHTGRQDLARLESLEVRFPASES